MAPVLDHQLCARGSDSNECIGTVKYTPVTRLANTMSAGSNLTSILWVAGKEFNQLVADRRAFRIEIRHQQTFQAARLTNIGAMGVFRASLTRSIDTGNDLGIDCRKQQPVRLVQKYGCPVRWCAWLVISICEPQYSVERHLRTPKLSAFILVSGVQ